MSALQIYKTALEEIADLVAHHSVDCDCQGCDAHHKARAALEAAAKAPVLADIAEEAVEAIVKDLSDRRGLRQEWEGIDVDIQAEIKLKWIDIITNIYQKGSK